MLYSLVTIKFMMGLFGFLKRKEQRNDVEIRDVTAMDKSAEDIGCGVTDKNSIVERLGSLEASLKSHVSLEVSPVLSEVSNLKLHVSSEVLKVSEQLANIFAIELRHLTERLETLPESTKQELEPLFDQLSKSRTPFAVKAMAEQISKKVSTAISDVVDDGLLSVLKERGSVTNNELVLIATQKGICSRASVFRHLKELEAKGKIKRLREGKLVYYSIEEAQVSGLTPETNRPNPDTYQL